METTAQLEATLLEYLRREVLRDDQTIPLDRETHLVEAGILDSLGFITFVSFVEKSCGVTFAPEDYTPEHLASVERCARYVAARLGFDQAEQAVVDEPTGAVREAQGEDLPAVAELWRELTTQHAAYGGSWQLAPQAVEQFRESLERTLASPQVFVLVAEEDGRVIGYVHGFVRANAVWFEERTVGTIVSICVSSDVRGRRIGQSLVGAAMARFREKGVKRVETLVAQGNRAALGFWEKAGFADHTRVLSKSLET